MPTIEQWIAIAGAAAILLSALYTVLKGHRESKSASVTSKAAIDARIDARIDAEMRRLNDQVTGLSEKVAKLERSESATKVENSAIKQAVKKWFHALRVWDNMGRRGPMPIPDDEDLARLELDPDDDPLVAAQQRPDG